MMTKKQVREQVSAARDALSHSRLAALSSSVERRLFDFHPFASCSFPLFFVSFRSEILTEGMIKKSLSSGKRVAVPVTKIKKRELVPSELKDFDAELAEGAYGVPEPKPEFLRPVSPLELDFVAMPGLAFDRSGNRLGYGGGFYDRFVSRLRPGVPLVALAFSFQLLDSVPTGEHDRKIDAIVTDSETIVFNPGISVFRK
ncbi:MAG TPA: 5-formyltetrahydrofolate cyclo-ligase [bacterium]|nr:5-formyltetrahydrofolate cyclo-ligase [bacterium]